VAVGVAGMGVIVGVSVAGNQTMVAVGVGSSGVVTAGVWLPAGAGKQAFRHNRLSQMICRRVNLRTGIIINGSVDNYTCMARML
jgi:hypothetical protein